MDLNLTNMQNSVYVIGGTYKPTTGAVIYGGKRIADPVAHFFLNASCDKAQFGWPCDAEIERLRDQYARADDPESQRAVAIAVQRRAAEYPTHVPLGQFTTPTALRRNVSGLLTAPAVVFWNVEKK